MFSEWNVDQFPMTQAIFKTSYFKQMVSKKQQIFFKLK